MRLIDADTLIQEIKRWKEREIADGLIGKGIKAGYDAAIICVSEMPTIEERKHGHWEPFININGEKTYRCSTCQNEAPHDLYGYFELTNYCPRCGAVMDKEASGVE